MTEDRQASILKKIRGLLAKANSTEHEGERIVFLAKADELMEKYAINEAMLKIADDPNAKLVIRKDMDFNWWQQLHGLDRDARSEIYWLWAACVKHVRCVTPGIANYVYTRLPDGTWDYKIPVFGTESDIAYLDLLFTDLFLQMVGKLKPKYDPNLEIGANVRLAKEAGMTWDQILDWSGLRDTALGKRLLPAYNKYCKEHGLQPVKMNPKTWQWGFISGYSSMIKKRLREMRAAHDAPTEGSMALALRSIDEQAREEMFGDFPSLRPHPADCQCDVCKNNRKPVKYRSRTYSYTASGAGSKAGEKARIVSNDPALRQRKQID